MAGQARVLPVFPLPFSPVQYRAELLTHGLLSGCRPKQPCRLEPFFRNAISRDKSVHELIVRRPAHPRRLVGVLVIGRIAAKPQAQLASAPEGSVIFSLSLGGVGKLISAPRPKVTAAERQIQLAHPPCSDAGTRTTIAAHRNMGGWVRD